MVSNRFNYKESIFDYRLKSTLFYYKNVDILLPYNYNEIYKTEKRPDERNYFL